MHSAISPLVPYLTKPLESIRYLDVHPVMPDDSPPELKSSFDGLLAPILLNSALAALKIQPQASVNAHIAIKNATRAIDNLDLSTADKGEYAALLITPSIHMCTHNIFSESSLSPSSCACYTKRRRRG